jgi:excisionase family DNA binding protein
MTIHMATTEAAVVVEPDVATPTTVMVTTAPVVATTSARLLYSIPDSLVQLGIGRSTLFELIGSGEIRTVKIGRRTLIAHDELVRYVHTLNARGGGDAA